MAPRIAVPSGGTEAEEDVSVPDLADDLADMLRRGRMVGPKRVARIMWIDEDGHESGVTLPVPRQPHRPAGLSQTALDILEVLEDRNGEWVYGADLVAALPGHPDHKSSSFTGPVRELRTAGLIETSQKNGYRLKDNAS